MPTLERISALGRIAAPERYIKRTRREAFCPGGGDGHSSNDAVEYQDVPVWGLKFTIPMGERRKARKELEIYVHSDEAIVKWAATNTLDRVNLLRREYMKDRAAKSVIAALALGVTVALAYYVFSR